MRKVKALILFSLLIITVFCTTGCIGCLTAASLINSNPLMDAAITRREKINQQFNEEHNIVADIKDPKYVPKGEYMLSKGGDPNEEQIANECLEKLKQKYNTNFYVLGYAYLGHTKTKTETVARVYLCSEEYPEVVFDYFYDDVNKERNGQDDYEENVQAWKLQNELYDIAKNSGIDINLMAIDLEIPTESEGKRKILGSIDANKSISENDIYSCIKELQDKEQLDDIHINLFIIENGDNEIFKYESDGGLLIDSAIPYDWGWWKQYEININETENKMELKWEENNR